MADQMGTNDQSGMNRRSTRHRLTRLGVQVMLIGGFGVLGGSLNGLNLLILVAGMATGVIIAQWRVSRAFIDALRVDRRLPAEVFAGKPIRVRYQLSNQHPLLPIWMIRIEDRLRLLNITPPAPMKPLSHSSITDSPWQRLQSRWHAYQETRIAKNRSVEPQEIQIGSDVRC